MQHYSNHTNISFKSEFRYYDETVAQTACYAARCNDSRQTELNKTDFVLEVKLQTSDNRLPEIKTDIPSKR